MNEQYPRILKGVLGLAGESGECVDMVKKHLFQGHVAELKELIPVVFDDIEVKE